jgi:ComF family protein
MKMLSPILNDFLELFYPSLCITCGERLISQEKFICLKCWLDLPVSRYHQDPDNKVAQLFWGRIPVEHATSYFIYRKGSRYQKLIHSVKYYGMKELGFETGRRFGEMLTESVHFRSVDLIVPVPLHPGKERKRGYNQSEWIARGIAERLNKPVICGNLQRMVNTSTQTRKDRFGRWRNVQGIFRVKNPGEFRNKHILLVDDVVTTGSTLEACASEIIKIPSTRVSISTLAYADI